MHLVLLSIICLFIGPFVSHVMSRYTRLLLWVNRGVFFIIFSVIFGHILPEVFQEIGWLALVLMSIGFGLPTVVEQILHKAAETVHRLTLAVGMLGLMAHSLLDGLSLTEQISVLSAGVVPALVILHRLFVGQLIWALLLPSFGYRVTCLTLVAVAAATLLGYWLGDSIQYLLHGVIFNLFQSFVVGAILHVTLFRSHLHSSQ